MKDRQPITEDDIEEYENYDSKLVKLVIYTNDRGLKKQILEGQKALEELPKYVKALAETNALYENRKLEVSYLTEENQKLKDGIKASKDVIDILWKQKQEVMNYAEQLKRTHQPIAESLAKILGIELNYD